VTVSANLDLVRSIFTEWERGDFRNVRSAHREIEYLVIGRLEPGRWDGLAAMTASVRDHMAAWESYGISAAELRELDRDRVLALVRLSGRGKTSGIDLTDAGGKGAEVWHLHDGVVTRLHMYFDRDRALADLGLEGG
jgi:ketosteroid isomerase-like protein